MPFFIDFAVATVLYILLARHWQKKSESEFFWNSLMFLYLSAVVALTLMPVIAALPDSGRHYHMPMNMEPFVDVRLRRGDYMRQIYLNVLMTVPFGILYPLVRRKRSCFFGMLFTVFLLSLGIELLQPVLSVRRTSDITDIITNVTGGILGYFVYLLLRKKSKQ